MFVCVRVCCEKLQGSSMSRGKGESIYTRDTGQKNTPQSISALTRNVCVCVCVCVPVSIWQEEFTLLDLGTSQGQRSQSFCLPVWPHWSLWSSTHTHTHTHTTWRPHTILSGITSCISFKLKAMQNPIMYKIPENVLKCNKIKLDQKCDEQNSRNNDGIKRPEWLINHYCSDELSLFIFFKMFSKQCTDVKGTAFIFQPLKALYNISQHSHTHTFTHTRTHTLSPVSLQCNQLCCLSCN